MILRQRTSHVLRVAGVLSLFAFATTVCSFAADPATLTWTQLQPATSFPARAGFATAYDPVSKKVIVFGGYDANGALYNETWMFNGSTWKKANAGNTVPIGRLGPSMAYDRRIKKIVMFGGSAGLTHLNDTWLFDGATLKWTLMHPTNTPPGASNAMLFTDPLNGHVDMFGGRRNQFYSRDTYQWSGTDWKLLNPTNSPFPRSGGVAVLDQAGKNVLVFGGFSDSWVTQNTWTWDGHDWTQLSPATQPDSLYYTMGGYVPALGQVVVFGGGDTAVDQDATWAWDGTNWSQLVPGGATPPAREQFGTVWDPASHQFLIFGGISFQSGQVFRDTWKLSGQ